MWPTTNATYGKEHLLLDQVSNLKTELVLSDTLTHILQYLIYTVTCQLIDIFGVVTNVINIICFIKQGFKDPVNVSFLGLAIADLGCLTTLLWSNICLTPEFTAADLPFYPLEFQYLTGAWPHATFNRVTSWITALITLERCLCITVPLKVRGFVTSKRVFIIIVSVFIILISAITPMYLVCRLDSKFYPEKNKTLLGLVAAENREGVETISFAINNVFIPFGAFTMIIICTVIIVIELNKNRKWRKKSTAAVEAGSVNRNQKVAKMVVMISSLFIACFIPFSIIFVGILIEPGLSIDGIYRNMIVIVIGIGVVLESINSSVNIFIYYRMSSKYRAVFRQLFCMVRREK